MSEAKTVRQWLEELPEPYRTLAVVNTKIEDLRMPVSLMSAAIDAAFAWNESPEGQPYWEEIYDKYTKEEFIASAYKRLNFSFEDVLELMVAFQLGRGGERSVEEVKEENPNGFEPKKTVVADKWLREQTIYKTKIETELEK